MRSAWANSRAACSPERLCTVPATEFALKHVGRPRAERGAAGRVRRGLTRRISLDSVAAAIREKFAGKVAEGNVAAAGAAYEYVTQRNARGAACSSRLKARTPSPRPSRCAGRR